MLNRQNKINMGYVYFHNCNYFSSFDPEQQCVKNLHENSASVKLNGSKKYCNISDPFMLLSICYTDAVSHFYYGPTFTTLSQHYLNIGWYFLVLCTDYSRLLDV